MPKNKTPPARTDAKSPRQFTEAEIALRGIAAIGALKLGQRAFARECAERVRLIHALVDSAAEAARSRNYRLAGIDAITVAPEVAALLAKPMEGL